MSKPAASTETEAVLASAIEVIGADGEVLRRVKLLPFGTFRGRDGRGPWVLADKAHAESVIAATRQFQGNADMMFDYDHQSALAAVPGVGGTAKASGWIKLDSLSAEDDGIYADVEWTEPAEAALKAKEYRYHSPYFRAMPGTGLVTRLVNAGLTNSPNLDLPALASQARASTEGELMTQIAMAPLVAALALSATAGEADVLAAIGALKSKADASDVVLASARTTLGLAANVDGEAVLAAVTSLKSGAAPDPTKWVPKTGFDELKSRVDQLDADKVLAMVDQAVAGGKVTPGMRQWAIDLGKKDIGELNSFLGVAPAFEGGATVTTQPKSDVTKLTEDERVVCSTMGWSEEEFLAQKK